MKPGNRPIRVLVADDSATALSCICRYLDFEGEFEIVATASDGLQLVQKTMRFRPELVLTDVSMPRLNGLEAITELRRLWSLKARRSLARKPSKQELGDYLLKETLNKDFLQKVLQYLIPGFRIFPLDSMCFSL